MTLILFGMALPWLLVGLGCWLTYQLARQNGRILLRLEGVEEQLGLLCRLLDLESSVPSDPDVVSAAVRGSPDPAHEQDRRSPPASDGDGRSLHIPGDLRSSLWGGSGPPRPAPEDPSNNDHAPKPGRGKANRGLAASRINRSGLKAGTPAPGFRLPRLDGGELALEDYRGRRVLLVLSDPECGPCEHLAPHLEEFHRRSGDVQVLMVSRRDADINRRKVKALGLTFPVVLQRHWQISLSYGIFATPVAYLINEQGIIDADVASGAEAIQALMAHVAAAGKEAVPIEH